MSLVSLISRGLNTIPCYSSSPWLVLGNEACDLDSAVSSIIYSLLLTFEGHPSSFILNVDRVEYPLKTEVCYWLNKHNLTQHNLLFRDDISFVKNKINFKPKQLEWIQQEENVLENKTEQEYLSALSRFQSTVNTIGSRPTNLCLVDHHMLGVRDQEFAPYVTEIVDHRPMEDTDLGSTKLTQAIVGSCCTLVTEMVLQRTPQLLQEAGVAALLHGCIVLDTVNFSAAAGRATPRDEAAVVALEGSMAGTVDRSDVFRQLLTAKADVSAMSPHQLLRRDMKLAGSICVCALPVPVQEFLSRPGSVSSLAQHNLDGGYTATVVMGVHIAGDVPVRDTAVYCDDAALLVKLCAALADAGDQLLQLQGEDIAGLALSGALRYFRQRNVKASRKQVMPIIMAFLKTL